MIAAEEQVLLGIEHGDLAGALGGLSPELRAVVQATVLDGLTTREAGRLLGIPAGHREDENDAGQGGAQGGIGMNELARTHRKLAHPLRDRAPGVPRRRHRVVARRPTSSTANSAGGRWPPRPPTRRRSPPRGTRSPT